MPLPPLDRNERHRRIAEAGSLQALLDQANGRAVLEAEANDPGLSADERLITPDQLGYLLTVRSERRRAAARPGLFVSTHDVIIVPGFMGSSLRDVRGENGLIWIDPGLLLNGGELAALKLAAFQGRNSAASDRDERTDVLIEASGAVPAIYDLLAADLNLRLYDVSVFAFDWRKDIERSALILADRIRGRLGRKARPLHLIAHSQGTIVARRAIQLLGADQARRLVNSLVLLGPASFGTFSAALALAGSHESIAAVRKFGVKLPQNLNQVFQSFTGLYQLLPWDPALFRTAKSPFDPNAMASTSFWKTGVDRDRLKYGFGWGSRVDATFFNDRTSIILGQQKTVGAVEFDAASRLVASGDPVDGDGTVPDFLAMIPGVRTYRAAGADHMTLPMHLSVMAAVRAILRGDTPALEAPKPALRAAKLSASERVPILAPPPKERDERKGRLVEVRAPVEPTAPTAAAPSGTPFARREPPMPPCRRLRVFSFDPLLATRLDTLEIARITIEIPWHNEERLGEGPVGEYVEVVDYDPASGCFYAPVDLTHPRLTAQDGLPPSESDPQFHQQMTYAVAMATIATFEKALGRVALWAPRLERDEDGEVIPTPPENQYVPRLRIYPHALRDANAFYDPDRHALLFGYFPSRDQPGGETMPGGTVFTCQSFDIIAHETTHALLHGLHQNYFSASNPDVLAFHEAFADAVALFQHFSHTEVVRHQVARTRGDLKSQNLLGQLALQFGQAMGEHRGALRQYIDAPPDPAQYRTTTEPHGRGAILMAALFRAFQNIYAQRSKDLYRIATGGTGKLPDGDIHPDLVNRLAVEAAKSARHLLNMCIRALDYVPPVDLTFGEYVRALITADYDLVQDDDRGYRVAVIEAFQSWGIYPSDVNVLDESALLWSAPNAQERDSLLEAVGRLDFAKWKLRTDRKEAFLQTQDNGRRLRSWLYSDARAMNDGGASLGLMVFGKGFHSIPRNKDNRPKFEVHSIRPCRRIGPDGEQRTDLVAVVIQRRAGFFDEAVQKMVDDAPEPWEFFPNGAADSKKGRPPLPQPPDFWFRGGSTLLIDPDSGEIRYCIRKDVRNAARLARQRVFERNGAFSTSAAMYFGTRNRNPFALLHTDD